MDAENIFREAYKKLAARGECDPPDSPEYARILTDWLAQGQPWPVSLFIVQQASSGKDETRD